MKVHSQFRINGIPIKTDQIHSTIKTLIKAPDLYDVGLGHFLSEWINESAYITVKTSGSTGIAKTIRLSKSSMVQSALNTLSYFNLQVEDSLCLVLPSTYIAGKMMIVRALVGGLNIITAPTSSTPFTHPLPAFNFTALVPNQIENFIKHTKITKNSCNILVGGGIISSVLMEKIQQSHLSFYQSYAMTETASHVAIRPINSSNATNGYSALPGISFSVNNRNCLIVKSNFLDLPSYTTNDIVELISPTSFIWNGRIDNIINSAGLKLNPELIEHKLCTIIKERFYIGKKEDDVFGQKIVLVMEADESIIHTKKLMGKMKDILNKHEVPKEIIRVKHFKETPTGKILREY